MHARTVVITGESARVLVDEGHAQQILLNLVQNAAQAGAQRVTLEMSRAHGRPRVVVVDDGPGIAPDMREQLFMPFATNKQRGTGLGLAASRRLARDNGGDLVHEASAASTSGASTSGASTSGARFVLSFSEPSETSP